MYLLCKCTEHALRPGQSNQAAIEAEEEEKRLLKLKNRAEMEKMLAANQDLHQRRAERISEEQAVS